MNIYRFAHELPFHYDNFTAPTGFTDPGCEFYNENYFPFGQTTKYIGHMLNFAVSLLEPAEAHLHVGVYYGRSLAYAMTNHLDKIHYAIDNFCVDPAVGQQFFTWMSASQYLHFMRFFVGNCFEIFTANPPLIEHPIGVYFYDADHTFEGQLNALRLVEPYLANEAIIIIDDANLPTTSAANQTWLSENPNAFLLFDLPTNEMTSPGWWDGVQVIGFKRR